MDAEIVERGGIFRGRLGCPQAADLVGARTPESFAWPPSVLEVVIDMSSMISGIKFVAGFDRPAEDLKRHALCKSRQVSKQIGRWNGSMHYSCWIFARLLLRQSRTKV